MLLSCTYCMYVVDPNISLTRIVFHAFTECIASSNMKLTDILKDIITQACSTHTMVFLHFCKGLIRASFNFGCQSHGQKGTQDEDLHFLDFVNLMSKMRL